VSRGKYKRYYVGQTPTGERQVFLSDIIPTEESHGHLFLYVIGPFRSKNGAQVMATYGKNNPHIQTVADAEALAKTLYGVKRRK